MELLRDLAQRDGVTVLAVLHDIVLARQFFGRLLLLDHGRLVADGPPADVLSDTARVSASTRLCLTVSNSMSPA